MAKDIKSLLNKKGWTGAEVGKALLATLVHDVRHKGAEHEPLFSQEDLFRMEGSLTSSTSNATYAVYSTLHSAITDSFNRGQAMQQQFSNGLSHLLLFMKELMDVEHAKTLAQMYPLIITEERYKQLENEAREKLQGIKESFRSLLFSLIEHYTGGEPEDTPKAIRDALNACKKEPATNQRLLSNYNHEQGEGYYQLPDGTRSDEVTQEEWIKILEKTYLASHELIIDGEVASYEETVKHWNTSTRLEDMELFFRGADAIRERLKEKFIAIGKKDRIGVVDTLSDNELLELVEETLEGRSGRYLSPDKQEIGDLLIGETPTKWYYYEDPPSDLTKYDFLESVSETYGGAVTRDYRGEEISEAQQYKEFKEDYPDLYKALKDYIEENISQAKGLKANQHYKEIISWGELAELGVGSFKRLTTPSEHDLIELVADNGAPDTLEGHSKTRKIFLNGIAVIKGSPRSYKFDEDGDFIGAEYLLASFNSLESMEGNTEQATAIDTYRTNLTLPALSYLYAFNALMKIIGNVYDVPELGKVVQQDTCSLESRIQGYNGLLFRFYFTVNGTKEEKRRNREIIKTLFKPLETDSLKPSREAIEAVTKELSELDTSRETLTKLTYLDNYIDTLTPGGGASL